MVGASTLQVGGVYDDAKKRYDHHQRGFEETFGEQYKTKLSSAGLIYKCVCLSTRLYGRFSERRMYRHYGAEIIATHLNIDKQDPNLSILVPKLYEDFIEGRRLWSLLYILLIILFTAIDGIDNGISQYEASDPAASVKQRYKSRTDLSARVGKLNPTWNEEYNDTVLDVRQWLILEIASHS